MNFYQEVTLLPDAEVSLDFLWHKVYQQIHIALVDNKSAKGTSYVAIAFPEYGSAGFRLGKKLRLVAEQKSQLEQLNITNWLVRLADYVHIKSIQAVPENTVPVSYIRQHVKGEKRVLKDMQQKAELWARKSGASVEQCLADLQKTKPDKHSRLPFVWMESLHSKESGKQHRPFPLFIKCIQGKLIQAGDFNCYGLSEGSVDTQLIATVPHF
ncbi:type I-F CRISPR-associated endoribonuclease Cas6/Csy4 [Providencia rettgeri]|uniref:type I-F CRISPR-associated endoribonuclease Cas6/Csy4 n=1 Tax=Providencia rettgeri TaxID=587 RepID=UPI0034E08691